MQHQTVQAQQTHEVNDAQWDYYAKRVATAGSDGVVRIYAYLSDKSDEESMRLIAEAKGHEAAVWKVSWSSPKFSSGLLASCGYDRRVIIWRESRPNIWERAYVYEGHDLSINTLAFAPFQFGLVLASGSSDGTVSLLLNKEGDWSIQRFMAHHTGVNSVSWAPFKNHTGSNRPFQEGPQTMRIASAGCDGLVKIWRLEHGQFLCEEALQSNVGGVNSWARVVAWSPVNESLIASAQGNTVLIWQQADRAGWQSRTLFTFPHEVLSLSWSQQGSDASPSLLAVATAGGDVSLWQPKSARAAGATTDGYPASPLEAGGSGKGRDAGWECISGPQASSIPAPASGSSPASTSAPGSGSVPLSGSAPSPSPSPPVSSGHTTQTI